MQTKCFSDQFRPQQETECSYSTQDVVGKPFFGWNKHMDQEQFIKHFAKIEREIEREGEKERRPELSSCLWGKTQWTIQVEKPSAHCDCLIASIVAQVLHKLCCYGGSEKVRRKTGK